MKYKTNDGRNVEFLSYEGSGTFSHRYHASLEESSKFIKTPRTSDEAHGIDTRAVHGNEIFTEELLALKRKDRLYSEYLEINNRLCIVSDFFAGHPNNSENLGNIININHRDLITPKKEWSKEQLLQWRLQSRMQLEADANEILELSDIINISKATAMDLRILHSMKFSEEEAGYNIAGIIHFDVTLENILIHKNLKTGILDVRLIDLALARALGRDCKYLLNRTVQTTANIGYYISSRFGLIHNLYHAHELDIESDTDLKAEPYFDLFNLGDIMSLMLTKKLTDFWKVNRKLDKDKFMAAIPEKFMPKSDETELLYLIVKRSISRESNPKATHFYKELNLIDLNKISAKNTLIRKLPLEIPQHIQNYTPTEPDFSKLFTEEKSEIEETLAKYSDSGNAQIPQDHLFPKAKDEITVLKQKYNLEITKSKKRNSLAKKYGIRSAILGIAALGIWGVSEYIQFVSCSPRASAVNVQVIEPDNISTINDNFTVASDKFDDQEYIEFGCYNESAGIRADFYLSIDDFADQDITKATLMRDEEKIKEWSSQELKEYIDPLYTQFEGTPSSHTYQLSMHTTSKTYLSEKIKVTFTGKKKDLPPQSLIHLRGNELLLSAYDLGDDQGIQSAKLFEDGELSESWERGKPNRSWKDGRSLIFNVYRPLIFLNQVEYNPKTQYLFAVEDLGGHYIETAFPHKEE